jgi:hypothetical protein
VTDFAKSIQDTLPSDFAGLYFLFQENDSVPSWTLNSLDAYILSAIGWKKPRVTYRLEEYPSSEWFVNNSFTDVIFVDSDSTRNFDTHFIEGVKKVVKTHQETIALKHIQHIGFFEEYISLINSEYLVYKKSRIDTLETAQISKSQVDTPPKTPLKQAGVSGRNLSQDTSEKNRFSLAEQTVALGCIVAMVVMFYLLAEKNRTITVGSGTVNTTGSSGWGASWGGGSSWGSSSSSSSVSGGKSSSSISSFGGGGFSKGSGG